MMNEAELLRSLRPIWLQRMVQTTAHGSGVSLGIRDELDHFFDLLVQTVETGDSTRIDATVEDWSSAMTEGDLETGSSSVIEFLRDIMSVSTEIISEHFTSENVTVLTTSLAATFARAFERAAICEVKTRMAYAAAQQERTRQNFERLDRSKSDFIAVAAHELKTPLTLVEGYTSMLRELLSAGGLHESETVLLDGINNGTRRLRTIIDDMIDVSLIDNSLLSLNFQPLWMDRLLDSITAELDEVARDRHLRLIVNRFEGCGEMSFGDPERLRQAFRNVLTNAVKFTPNGGMIEIDGRKLPGFIEIFIKDSGIGIDPEDQALIFEKFSRLGNPSLHSSGKTKYKGGGPGLGLHITRGIIEAHGGTIWVESPGYNEQTFPGSTFHILLPAREEPPDVKTAKLFAPLIQSKSFQQP